MTECANDTLRILCVLVVEDAPTVCKMYAAGFATDPGIRAEFAGSLVSGLWCVERACYDVIVLDLFLPDAANLEALHAVRAAAPDVPVVVATGSEILGAAAIDAGAHAYLFKRLLSPPELVQAVRRAAIAGEVARKFAGVHQSLHSTDLVLEKLEAVGREIREKREESPK